MADTKQTREEYQKDMEARLSALGAELDKLKARANEVGAGAREQYEERMAALRSQMANAQEHLRELQQSSGEAWDSLKSGFEKAWNDLQQAVAQARERF